MLLQEACKQLICELELDQRCAGGSGLPNIDVDPDKEKEAQLRQWGEPRQSCTALTQAQRVQLRSSSSTSALKQQQEQQQQFDRAMQPAPGLTVSPLTVSLQQARTCSGNSKACRASPRWTSSWALSLSRDRRVSASMASVRLPTVQTSWRHMPTDRLLSWVRHATSASSWYMLLPRSVSADSRESWGKGARADSCPKAHLAACSQT